MPCFICFSSLQVGRKDGKGKAGLKKWRVRGSGAREGIEWMLRYRTTTATTTTTVLLPLLPPLPLPLVLLLLLN